MNKNNTIILITDYTKKGNEITGNDNTNLFAKTTTKQEAEYETIFIQCMGLANIG